jgi:hypothetical protein
VVAAAVAALYAVDAAAAVLLQVAAGVVAVASPRQVDGAVAAADSAVAVAVVALPRASRSGPLSVSSAA